MTQSIITVCPQHQTYVERYVVQQFDRSLCRLKQITVGGIVDISTNKSGFENPKYVRQQHIYDKQYFVNNAEIHTRKIKR